MNKLGSSRLRSFGEAHCRGRSRVARGSTMFGPPLKPKQQDL